MTTALLVRGERPTALALVGGALLVSGVAVTTLRRPAPGVRPDGPGWQQRDPTGAGRVTKIVK